MSRITRLQDAVAPTISLQNKFVNGSFEMDTIGQSPSSVNGWISHPMSGLITSDTISDFSPTHGSKSIYARLTENRTWARSQLLYLISGHKYFFSMDMIGKTGITNTAHGFATWQYLNSTSLITILAPSPVPLGLYKYSIIHTAVPNENRVGYFFGTMGVGNAYVFLDRLICVDLTETFGVNNEPNITWCNEHIRPYIVF